MRSRRLIGVVLTCVLSVFFAPSAGAQESPSSRNKVREIAVTFDDLPGLYSDGDATVDALTRKLLHSIKSNRVPAVGFVNENKLNPGGRLDTSRVATLKLWVDAGLELGNHTYSHGDLHRTPLAEFVADVVRGETTTRALLRRKGMKLRYFRHPFLHAGEDIEKRRAFEKFLAGRGYQIAPVTIDNDDYVYAAAYSEARRMGDAETMRRVAREYVPYMEGIFDFFEKYSVDVAGYEIKQVLLLHASELNADTFDQLAAMMKRRGYRFITLEQALADPAYRLPNDYAGPHGTSWLYRWAMTKGMKDDKLMPRYPGWLQKLWDEREKRMRAGGSRGGTW